MENFSKEPIMTSGISPKEQYSLYPEGETSVAQSATTLTAMPLKNPVVELSVEPVVRPKIPPPKPPRRNRKKPVEQCTEDNVMNPTETSVVEHVTDPQIESVLKDIEGCEIKPEKDQTVTFEDQHQVNHAENPTGQPTESSQKSLSHRPQPLDRAPLKRNQGVRAPITSLSLDQLYQELESPSEKLKAEMKRCLVVVGRVTTDMLHCLQKYHQNMNKITVNMKSAFSDSQKQAKKYEKKLRDLENLHTQKSEQNNHNETLLNSSRKTLKEKRKEYKKKTRSLRKANATLNKINEENRCLEELTSALERHQKISQGSRVEQSREILEDLEKFFALMEEDTFPQTPGIRTSSQLTLKPALEDESKASSMQTANDKLKPKTSTKPASEEEQEEERECTVTSCWCFFKLLQKRKPKKLKKTKGKN
nr:PREDICTED: uncharacterized protein LOC106704329 [Latimeria chalumnae]|eukprot:XP_014346554.1 PREDICTED: uncharacterized protein LOC106704329 [Latimeria chalumnae]